MKLLLFVFVCLSSIIQVVAQGEFVFEKEAHDFGVITEGTQAKFEFKFVNSGNEPIVLSSVNASCGCTTPFYTKDPVMPGETGSIKVNYNSRGRMGAFKKSITIRSNVEKTPVVYIKGIVEKSIEVEEYSLTQLANSSIIKVDKDIIAMGVLEKGKETKGTFTISNEGKADLVIKSMKSACNCINVIESTQVIKVGASSIVTFLYSPEGVGKVEDILTIYSNDLSTKSKAVTLVSNIKETLAPNNMLKSNTSSGF